MKKPKNEISDRQKLILRIIVEEYIKNANPVGSNKILELSGIDISSATIRGDSSLLEEMGYLEKSHTSSGRIPSTTGYRYYVDNLMQKNHIKDIQDKIDSIFSNREESIETVLSHATKLISEMTNLVTVVTTRDLTHEVTLSKVELVPIGDYSGAMIIILSNGEVSNKLVEFDSDISLEEYEKAIKIFNERLIGAPVSEVQDRVDMITPIIKEQVDKYEFILKTFVSTVLHEKTIISETRGMNNLLENPEFSNPLMIKQVVSLIEDTSLLTWFDKSTQDEQKPFFKIGDETGISNDIALVSKNVKVQDGKELSLAVVGPKRIHYQLVSEMLEMFGKKLEQNYKKKK